MSIAPKTVAVVAIVAAISVALGCGRPELSERVAIPVSTSTPTPINPEVILKRASQVMEELESLHFLLSHELGRTQLGPGLVIDEVEGDIASPDRLSVMFSGSFGTGFAINVSLISIEGASYMTNPFTGEWEVGPTGVSALGFFDPRRGIGSMISQVDKLSLLTDATDRHGMYKIGGYLMTEALAPLLGTTLVGESVRVELTIDAERLYLIEARIIGRVAPTDDKNIIRVVALSAFDKPISIEAPL